MSTESPELYEQIFDVFGLDAFERIAAWDIMRQLADDPYNDALNIQLGLLVERHVPGWAA